MWEIAGLSDREVIMAELTDHLEHFDFPEEDDLDEDEVFEDWADATQRLDGSGLGSESTN